MARARTKEPDRRTFLGGTDAPAVLGVSEWMTPLDLWRLKTGRVKPEPNLERDQRLKRGKRLEPFICEMVVDKLRDQGHEVKVLARNERYTHPKYPFLKCEIDLELEQSMIEKEPVTVVCSEKGWIRTMKGHMEDFSTLSYKDGDRGQHHFHAMSTDKVMLFSSSGKFFTLDVGKLPGGRGHGEPVRLMADVDAADQIVALFVYQPGAKRLLASSEAVGSSRMRSCGFISSARINSGYPRCSACCR